jgi:hypothetical protein
MTPLHTSLTEHMQSSRNSVALHCFPSDDVRRGKKSFKRIECGEQKRQSTETG